MKLFIEKAIQALDFAQNPLFSWLGYPMAPILKLLGIPDASKVAPAVLLGFIEVNLPENEYEPYYLLVSKDITWLEKLGESVFYPKKHILTEPGQYTNYCYWIKRGTIVSYESDKNGEESFYHFYGKNSFILEAELLFDKKVPVGFMAMSACELIRINKHSLLQTIKSNPQFALELIAFNSLKYNSILQRIRCERNYSAAWKICNLFLSFAEHYGVFCGNQILIQERISQQTMSNLLGMNRVTVARAIKSLKNMGLVEQKRGIYCICDIQGFINYQESLDVS